eukprot:CAMPEP_0196790280 /NCGR_PEP_ID=MMETSP1104-20130614/27971_1 /TAXON_ID=33652 /ORGANISM="Cafeteria sp., Strain Caron Lab Isolate" /LENGTH=113 /DNA_ID=CAMNT_0042160645 /DNA_START=21 /DNA_END=360 /DNA_ORIENTATION=-
MSLLMSDWLSGVLFLGGSVFTIISLMSFADFLRFHELLPARADADGPEPEPANHVAHEGVNGAGADALNQPPPQQPPHPQQQHRERGMSGMQGGCGRGNKDSDKGSGGGGGGG